MIGSLGTGDFDAFNRVLLNFSKVKDPSSIYAFNQVIILDGSDSKYSQIKSE